MIMCISLWNSTHVVKLVNIHIKYVCMYVYIYIYIYTYTCIYVNIYNFNLGGLNFEKKNNWGIFPIMTIQEKCPNGNRLINI